MRLYFSTIRSEKSWFSGHPNSQVFAFFFKTSKFQIFFIDPWGKTDTLAPLLVINAIVFWKKSKSHSGPWCSAFCIRGLGFNSWLGLVQIFFVVHSDFFEDFRLFKCLKSSYFEFLHLWYFVWVWLSSNIISHFNVHPL